MLCNMDKTAMMVITWLRLPPTWRAASTQVPPTYMEGPWTSERIISFYVAEKKKYFGTLANEVVW